MGGKQEALSLEIGAERKPCIRSQRKRSANNPGSWSRGKIGGPALKKTLIEE